MWRARGGSPPSIAASSGTYRIDFGASPRRKKQNIKERARLLALLGKKQSEEGGKKDDESDLDSDSDPEEIA